MTAGSSSDAVRFSVVTVTFDNRAGLAATGASVLAQTGPSFEWIVIDGASRDGTSDDLRAAEDPRLRFVSEPDRGIFDAMNKGLALARGEYVVFMNAGDLFAGPDVLDAVNAVARRSDPDLIWGDSLESDGAQSFYKAARAPAENRTVMFTHHQAIVYRTDIAKALGYDLRYRLSCDWVMTTRFLARTERLAHLPRPICVFERGGVSQRQDQRRTLNRELFRIYREEQGFGLARASYLWLRKVAINRVRRTMPSLYDRIRYRRPVSSDGERARTG